MIRGETRVTDAKVKSALPSKTSDDTCGITLPPQTHSIKLMVKTAFQFIAKQAFKRVRLPRAHQLD